MREKGSNTAFVVQDVVFLVVRAEDASGVRLWATIQLPLPGRCSGGPHFLWALIPNPHKWASFQTAKYPFSGLDNSIHNSFIYLLFIFFFMYFNYYWWYIFFSKMFFIHFCIILMSIFLAVAQFYLLLLPQLIHFDFLFQFFKDISIFNIEI